MNVKAYATKIIDEVHTLWESKKTIYPGGYAVFFSAIREAPDLCLLGLNPGGGEKDFSNQKEQIIDDEAMEYVRYRNCRSYPLAGKSVSLFEAAGFLQLLSSSVKTNLSFFRSRNWKNLPPEDYGFCRERALQFVKQIKPAILFCESMMALDEAYAELSKAKKPTLLSSYQRNKKRKYASYLFDEERGTKLLIGICHLTGSRPSNGDIGQMTLRLKRDLLLVMPNQAR